uniref:G-protein coupled receptors family 1 profile domain-containing protein n=1 Tax=Ditylenchus dipsaci TaxID=166011 RepID=A0A915D5K4_9BILA
MLNLVVLLNRRMRSRTNIFLAAVAFADIFFLFLMLPFTIKYNAFLRQIKVLNLFMQYTNLHITGLINMCAFASTWFLVTVCFERLLAVRWPLKARTFWSNRARPSRIICLVWLLAFFVTMYSHITHTVTAVLINEPSGSDTVNLSALQKQQRYVLRTQLRPNLFHYWRIATIFHTVLQVFVLVLLPLDCPSSGGHAIVSSSHAAKHSPANQKRATIVVLIIASTFAAFQLPSAIVYIWELITPEAPMHKAFITVATLANSLVVTGKMANFFLFCMSSRNFRKNLRRILCNSDKSAKSSLSGATGNGCSNPLHPQQQHPVHRQRPDSTPAPARHHSIYLATLSQMRNSNRRRSDQTLTTAINGPIKNVDVLGSGSGESIVEYSTSYASPKRIDTKEYLALVDGKKRKRTQDSVGLIF